MTCRISLGFTRQLLDPEWSGSALKEFAFALSSCKRVCLCLLVQGTTLGLGFSGASIAADCSVCLVACRNSGRLRGSVICPLLAPARHTQQFYIVDVTELKLRVVPLPLNAVGVLPTVESELKTPSPYRH